jgi:hypothetical protein
VQDDRRPLHRAQRGDRARDILIRQLLVGLNQGEPLALLAHALPLDMPYSHPDRHPPYPQVGALVSLDRRPVPVQLDEGILRDFLGLGPVVQDEEDRAGDLRVGGTEPPVVLRAGPGPHLSLLPSRHQQTDTRVAAG